MHQQSVDTTTPVPAHTPGTAPGGRRFERRREVLDKRHRTDDERRAEARRRALVSVWLRQLAKGG
jgi:hypothetical protein